jgi:hypothetical protein
VGYEGECGGGDLLKNLPPPWFDSPKGKGTLAGFPAACMARGWLSVQRAAGEGTKVLTVLRARKADDERPVNRGEEAEPVPPCTRARHSPRLTSTADGGTPAAQCPWQEF